VEKFELPYNRVRQVKIAMKTISCILSIATLLFLCACAPPAEEFNVETAIAQIESEVNVETAVAQMVATQTAAALPGASTQAAPTLQPSPTSTNCTLNQNCQAAGISLMITAISTESEIGRYWQAPAGSLYLVIDVTIKNIDRDQSPYNPTWFTVTDAQGRSSVGNNFAPLPDLQNGSLGRGQEISGKVSFQVSADATGFSVIYLPADPMGNYLPIQVDIGTP
jgi:hypothetical protein